MDFITYDIVLGIFLVFGLICLVIEAIIPGISLPGLVGLIFSINAIYMIWNKFGLVVGLISLGVFLLIFAILFSVAIHSLKSGRLNKGRLVLKQKFNAKDGYTSAVTEEELVGMEGISLSYLRPVGIALINNKRYEVVSQGEFIPKNKRIKVLEVKDFRIIVELLED